jgi:hypothetical protein
MLVNAKHELWHIHKTGCTTGTVAETTGPVPQNPKQNYVSMNSGEDNNRRPSAATAATVSPTNHHTTPVAAAAAALQALLAHSMSNF